MTLQQLKYFCAVSQKMSFTSAADMLHISQPSISNAIADMENELGFILFERKGRHIELTKYGYYYYQHISEILQQLDYVTEKTKTLAHGETGAIDLAYNAPFGRRIVPKIARGFLDNEDNNECTFNFHQASSPKIIEGLQSGIYDVGICTTEPITEGIKYIPIMHQELVGIVPEDHELAKNDKVKLSELLKFPYVDYKNETGLYKLIHKIIDSCNLKPKITAKAPDEDSIAALVSSGFGVSFVASVYVLKNYDVKILHIENQNYFRTIFMAHNSEHYLTPAVTRFIKYVNVIKNDIAEIL